MGLKSRNHLKQANASNDEQAMMEVAMTLKGMKENLEGVGDKRNSSDKNIDAAGKRKSSVFLNF